jgi:glutamate---cysteine ligase / carboxylate-amine ligase
MPSAVGLPNTETWPEWARWNETPAHRYTLGVEEEVMLVNAADHAFAPSSDAVLRRLPDGLAQRMSLETHASVVELRTGIHGDAAGACAELAELRAGLACELATMELLAVSAGTHPLAGEGDTATSNGARYRFVADTMGLLARREPTSALHVHVGVPCPHDAIRALNGLRGAIPALIALSANSPFCQGRDSGFASARTVIFQAFPRTGTARPFADYAEYVTSIDVLIDCGALPDPSFLWWDVRLQPTLGTVEVRVMDAQTTVDDSAPLIALVQCLTRLALEDEVPWSAISAEVLAENRFLAARDGLDARLVDPATLGLVPVRGLIDDLLARCRPHAQQLGCESELDAVAGLAACNGAQRQRASALGGQSYVVSTLAERFAAS